MSKHHKHHIIPKHMGGSDDNNNIQILTVPEHAEAHRKLYEKHGKWQDKIAWLGLTNRIGKEEIIRLKQSLANKGKIITEEQREVIRKANLGNTNAKGHILSDECRKRISKKLKGRSIPDERKKRISKTLKGKYLPEQHRNNISKGKKGKSLSEQHKRNISKTTDVKCIVIYPNGKEEIINELGQFCKKYNLHKRLAKLVMKGKRNHTGGFIKRSVKPTNL